jgi:DNA-binding GntR family transcriptional regulator
MNSAESQNSSDLPLHAAVSKVIRLNIESGNLNAGMLLRESELVAQFTVSRVPISRALRELVGAGILEKASRGFLVSGRQNVDQQTPPQLNIPESLAELFKGKASWEKIYSKVEGDIVAAMPFGRYKITEAGMAEYYHVSRTVTGDLLVRLQERGLVERRGRSQIQVPALTEQLMVDLYEVRAILEPAALVRSAPFLGKDRLERMKQQLRSAEVAYPAVTLDDLAALENELHVSFLEQTPNKRLLASLRTSQLPLLATNYLLKRYLGTPETEPFLAEHRIIVELLLNGATEEAGSALKAHLRSACEKGVKRIELVRKDHKMTPLPYLKLIE